MRFYYFDTSALVKAYLPEAGTDRVREILTEVRTEPATGRAFACSIVYPEAVSAVTKRENMGKLTAFEVSRAVQQIEQDFSADPPRPYEVLDATRPIVTRAATLVRSQALRGFDAVHLAAALELRDVALAVSDFLFATTDKRLATAAEAEGFTLLELT